MPTPDNRFGSRAGWITAAATLLALGCNPERADERVEREAEHGADAVDEGTEQPVVEEPPLPGAQEPQPGARMEAQGPLDESQTMDAREAGEAGAQTQEQQGERWTELSARQGSGEVIGALTRELRKDEYDVQEVELPGQDSGKLLVIIPAGDRDDDQAVNDVEDTLQRVRMVAVMGAPKGEQSRIIYEHDGGMQGITRTTDPVFAAISRAGGVGLSATDASVGDIPVNPMEAPTTAMEPGKRFSNEGKQQQGSGQRDASEASDESPAPSPSQRNERRNASPAPAQADNDPITDPILDPDEPRPGRPQPPEPDPHPDDGPQDGNDATPPPL